MLAAILTQNDAARINMFWFLLETQTREHAGMLAAGEDSDMFLSGRDLINKLLGLSPRS